MNKKAQVVLETALVIITIVILLVGIMRIWAWFVNTYTGRWEMYNQKRVEAGQPTAGFIPDGYNKTENKLDLFK